MGNSPKGEYMLKKENIMKMLGIGIMSLFLLGCAENSFLLTEEESPQMKDLMEGQGYEEGQMAVEEKQTSEKNTETAALYNVEEKYTKEQEVSSIQEIVVHICGAVNNPGVFFLEEGQRVYHAIELAGGLREDADGDYMNQALLLEDGMKLVIPTKEETKQWKEKEEKEQSVETKLYEGKETEAYYVEYANSNSLTTGNEKVEKVNLNTADETLLCTLPGIGSSRAKSIIDYRVKNGAFHRIEDVMKVSGIKEAAFEKIKDLITVSE